MSNRFEVTLHLDALRWAAAEGVSETVIAAVLLLHDRTVEKVASQVSASELEHRSRPARTRVASWMDRTPG
jgi:hypothetical protein